MYKEEPVEVPYKRLKKDVLDSLIEEFICREATDYGEEELLFEEKKVKIYFEAKNETINFVAS